MSFKSLPPPSAIIVATETKNRSSKNDLEAENNKEEILPDGLEVVLPLVVLVDKIIIESFEPIKLETDGGHIPLLATFYFTFCKGQEEQIE